MLEYLLQMTDPVTAAILVAIWWRLEKISSRVNRIENTAIEEGIQT